MNIFTKSTECLRGVSLILGLGLLAACDLLPFKEWLAGDAQIVDVGPLNFRPRYHVTLPRIPMGRNEQRQYLIVDIPEADDYSLELIVVAPKGHLMNNAAWSEFSKELEKDNVLGRVRVFSSDGATNFFDFGGSLSHSWEPGYVGPAGSGFYPPSSPRVKLSGTLSVEVQISAAPGLASYGYLIQLKLEGGGIPK